MDSFYLKRTFVTLNTEIWVLAILFFKYEGVDAILILRQKMTQTSTQLCLGAENS